MRRRNRVTQRSSQAFRHVFRRQSKVQPWENDNDQQVQTTKISRARPACCYNVLNISLETNVMTSGIYRSYLSVRAEANKTVAQTRASSEHRQ